MVKRRTVEMTLLGALVAAGVGCGSDDAITENNIGEKLAQTLCAAEARCCQEQGAPLSATNMMLCEALAPAVFANPAPPPFHAGIAAACLRAAQDFRCVDRYSIDSVCGQVFQDLPGPGFDCASDADCAAPSGGYAACTSSGCRGYFAPEGAPCAGQEHACAEGLTCVGAAAFVTGTCTKQSAAGGSCQSADDCVYGTDCDLTAHVCVAWAKVDEPCGVRCEVGATCDGTICRANAPGACTVT
jgi:hypothetical protein